MSVATSLTPLGLGSSFSSPRHCFHAGGNALGASKLQCRGGWRVPFLPRAMACEASDGPSRRDITLAAVLAGASLATTVGLSEDAEAESSSRRALRSEKIPESEFKSLPNGLKYYDVKIGGGKAAEKGSRVAVFILTISLLDQKLRQEGCTNGCSSAFIPLPEVGPNLNIHYVAKWKGITFMTSRQGMGVTGGSPYGFDVGASEYGIVLKGLDYGVVGMRVGGQRLLIVPPELAYGNKGIQEIPPNATLQFDVELLSIKQNAFGSPVKIVEG